MKCLVFSTFRQVRDYVAVHDNRLLPKLYTMEEFLSRLVVVPGRSFVDPAARVLYLYRAASRLDLSSLGFGKNFLGFVKNAEFVFRFFEELTAERVKIDDLRGADLYAEYEEHLTLLEAIHARYAELLEAEGLTDRVTMGEYRLNEGFLKALDSIEIHVDGYLSRFELEVLGRVDRPLTLVFETTPYNRRLTERLGLEGVASGREMRYDLHTREILEERAVAPMETERIEVAAFEERIAQVAWALERVERFVSEGADPSKVAVVLPDEGFADSLRLFDRCRNFNYAMGIPFIQSAYYRRLADLYDALTDRSDSARLKMEGNDLLRRFEAVESFGDFLAFLEALPTTPRELRALDEVKFGFARLEPLLKEATPLQLLHTWLGRLEPLHLDDTEGGKVTVMGLLESRGKHFDGVVIVDFNEENVPRVGEKDLFLNSLLRKRAGMPTRIDKENLQKNYYYLLMRRAKRVALSYVRNEEAQPSRFLTQLGLEETEISSDARYRTVLFPEAPRMHHWEEVPEGPNPFRREKKLTPTRLKDFLTCPRRFWFRYVRGIRPEEETRPPVMGTLVHKALEEAARAKERFDSAERYHEFVMDRLYRSAQSRAERFEMALTWEPKLRNFCARDFERLMHSEQPVLEEWCEVEHEGFLLSAKADRVDLAQGTVRVIDYKTNRDLKKLLKDETDHQLAFYHLWAEDAYPGRRIVALYEDLYGGESRTVEMEERKERLTQTLRELAEPESLRYEMCEESTPCKWCDYRIACNRD